MKKYITWYQVVEITLFILAVIFCVVIGVRVDSYSQTIAEKIYEQEGFEGIAYAILYAYVWQSKFYAMFVLAIIVVFFSLMGVIIDRDTRHVCIDRIIFVVSSICVAIGGVYIICYIISAENAKTAVQIVGELINIALRCGFGLPMGVNGE